MLLFICWSDNSFVCPTKVTSFYFRRIYYLRILTKFIMCDRDVPNLLWMGRPPTNLIQQAFYNIAGNTVVPYRSLKKFFYYHKLLFIAIYNYSTFRQKTIITMYNIRVHIVHIATYSRTKFHAHSFNSFEVIKGSSGQTDWLADGRTEGKPIDQSGVNTGRGLKGRAVTGQRSGMPFRKYI